MLFERLIVQQVWRELDEVHDLGCVQTTQSSEGVVKLSEAGSYSLDSKLSFRLSKPDSSIISPELKEFEGNCVYTEVS